jgi:Domain of Unknown Function with PDB structure (DUF3857)
MIRSKIISSIVAMLIGVGCEAQFEHNYGAISDEEIGIKECPFQKTASAMIMVDEGFSDYDDDELISYMHKRIKILRKEGVKYASVSIGCQSGNKFERIVDIAAVTINFDEKGQRSETPVSKKSIYTRKINDYITAITFAFPAVKEGSFIEYKYKSIKQNWSGLGDWYFQCELPVKFSAYTLRVAPWLEFSYSVHKLKEYEVNISRFQSKGTYYFEMKNVAALGDEIYMDCREDNLQKVAFRLTSYQSWYGNIRYLDSWTDVNKKMNSIAVIGGQLKINTGQLENFPTFSDRILGDSSKLTEIFNYVRTNIKWNRITSAMPDGDVKLTWIRKAGSSAAVNMLLLVALKTARINCYPLLVSTRGHGKIDSTFPDLNAFNSICVIAFINGKRYIMDASDDHTPLFLTPVKLLNTCAFIIDDNKGQLLRIVEDRVKTRKIILNIASLYADGTLSGHVEIVSNNYHKILAGEKRNESDKESGQEYKSNGEGNISVDSFTAQNSGPDSSAFTQSFVFNAKTQATGDYTFLDLDIFMRMKTNPFISSVRFSDINFGYPEIQNMSFNVRLDKRFNLESLPQNIRITNKDKTLIFSRLLSYSPSESKIIADIRFERTKTFSTASEYEDLRSFYNKIAELMNEQVVLKSKNHE